MLFKKVMMIQGRSGMMMKMKMLVPTKICNIDINQSNFIELKALNENQREKQQKDWTHFIVDDHIHSSRWKYHSSGTLKAHGTDYHASKWILCLSELEHGKQQTFLPSEDVMHI
jgi:hypothetical protein